MGQKLSVLKTKYLVHKFYHIYRYVYICIYEKHSLNLCQHCGGYICYGLSYSHIN